MPVVLTDGVLKSAFPRVNDLCPLWVIGMAENPAAIVLGFNHEDSGICHENMVDLCRSEPVFECDVVEQDVRALKTVRDGVGNQSFADVATEAKGPTNEHTQGQSAEERDKSPSHHNENRNHGLFG